MAMYIVEKSHQVLITLHTFIYADDTALCNQNNNKTRQHSYRTVDRAMRPIYGCSEKFSESSLRTRLFFQKFVMDFCSDRCYRNVRTKVEVCSFTRS